MMKRKECWLAFYVLCAAAIGVLWWNMHTYRLDTVPYEMHVDEYGIGYDAFCIANYGCDKWLAKNPVYLNNLGGGSSLAYVLLCALCIKLTGSTAIWVIRFPAVLVSFVTMVLFFLILRKRLGILWGFLGAILYNFLPYYTMQSRLALDCNFMLCAMLMLIWMYMIAFEKPDIKRFLLLGFVCGMALYTYIIAWVVVPVVIILVSCYGLYTGRIQWRHLLVQAVPCAVMALPLILFAAVNVFDGQTISFVGMTVPRLLEDRVSVFTFSNIGMAIGNFFKVIFYGDGYSYNSVYGYFTMYRFSVPFVAAGFGLSVYGMIKAIKDKKPDVLVVINALFVAELLLAMMLGYKEEEVYINVNRINGVYAVTLLYLILCLYAIGRWCGRLAQKIKGVFQLAAYAPVLVIGVIYCSLFVGFAKYYFVNYRIDIWPQYCFAGPLDDVVEFFGQDFYERPVHMDATYAQMLLATRISPYDFDAPSVYAKDKDMQSWKNMVFNVYGDIDTSHIYIIYKGHPEFIEYYSMFDFKIYEAESYVCFYN